MAQVTTTAAAEIKYSYNFECEHCGTYSGEKNAAIKGGTAIQGNNTEHALKIAEMDLLFQIEKAKKRMEKQNYPKDIIGKCDKCGKYQSWMLANAKKGRLIYAAKGFGIGIGVFILLIIIGGEDTSIKYIWPFIPVGLIAGIWFGFSKFAKVKKDMKSIVEKKLPIVLFKKPYSLYCGFQPMNQPADLTILRSEGTNIMLNGKIICWQKDESKSFQVSTDFACNAIIVFDQFHVLKYYLFKLLPSSKAIISLLESDMDKNQGITFLSDLEMRRESQI